MSIFILATTIFCNLVSPTKIQYAPMTLTIPYEETNIWQEAEWPEFKEGETIPENVKPIREWSVTNVTTKYRFILNPTANDYLAAGWKYNRISPAESKEGYFSVLDKYAVSNDSVVATYKYEPIPEKPVRYSKRRFCIALAKYGVYKEVTDWLQATEVIEGSGLTAWTLLSQSEYMESCDDDFKAIYAVSVQRYGKEKMDKILEESIDE